MGRDGKRWEEMEGGAVKEAAFKLYNNALSERLGGPVGVDCGNTRGQVLLNRLERERENYQKIAKWS